MNPEPLQAVSRTDGGTAPTFHIGVWRFDPSEPVLRDADRERRLEDRAARTLELLCRRRGRVVSKEELIAEVWGGRTVSSNSVSIVIGGLRRALGDDPRDPVHLVTVARRGYRLAAEDGPPTRPPSRVDTPIIFRAGRFLALAGSGAAAVAMLAHVAARPVPITVEAPRNATGLSAYATMAASLRPVVVDGMTRLRGVRVLDGSAPDARIVVRSRLILWNGAPELAIDAIDARHHSIVWTGFAAGPPAELARHVTTRLLGLQRRLPG